jgi:hypothetical protein
MASVLKVDKLDPQSGTALEIGTSGDTITVPSGATFAVSGTMNASSITAGTVATARLGTGTASSSTVLYGDQTYKTEPTGASTLGELTDVSMDIANFTDSLLIQTNSDGSAPTTGTLSGSAGNIGIGKNVFSALTSGSDDTCLGGEAGAALLAGSGNTFLGVNCGKAVTSGDYNILIGSGAGDNFDAESHNIGIGKDSLGGAVAGGEYNVAIGSYTGDAINAGDKNVIVGYNTGSSLLGGGENVLVGTNIGDTLGTGSNNIIIGYGNDVDITNRAWTITMSAQSLTIDADNVFKFGKGSNEVSNTFTSDANWSRSSDVRKKKEIHDQELGLDFINDLRTVNFKWKPSNEFPKEWNDYSEENNMDLDVTMHGFIAQEVKESLDKHANDKDINFGGWSKGKDGMQNTSREMYVIPLVKAVQELSEKVKDLEKKLEAK